MSAVQASPQGFIKNRYKKLSQKRSAYLDRAYKYSEVTLRYIMPENDDPSTEEMQRDFSSTGADSVTTLANKYMLALFPANKSFFKLTPNISDRTAEHIGVTPAEMKIQLTRAEREARRKLESRHGRPALIDIIKHLIITGNALLYYPDDGNIQMYPLDQFVVNRTILGEYTEIITEDKKMLDSLDEELRELVMSTLDIEEDADLSSKEVTLYTYIKSNPDNYKQYIVEQAVEDMPINEPFTVLKEKNRWTPLVWNVTRREEYGRGLVEEHYGNLWSLNILSEALVTAAAAICDIKYGVDPSSTFDVAELNNSPTGSYHLGNPESVGEIGGENKADLRFVQEMIDKYERQIGKAFLSISTQIRDSERTTAYENRLRAQELEQAHAGVFSQLALNLQKPLATLLLDEFDITLKDSGIELVVVSGLDAMGRVSENEKILQLFEDLAVLNNVPEQLVSVFRYTDTVRLLANGRDVEVDEIIKSDKELQQEQQARAQAQQNSMAQEQMIKKASPEQLAEGMQGE